jgi:hypothetical protein
MLPWPNREFLELWGNTLLMMAKFPLGPAGGLLEVFQNTGCAAKRAPEDFVFEPFMQLWQKTFGKEGIERFNAVFKDFFLHAGVVPRSQYNELRDKYLALQEKVVELEKSFDKLRLYQQPAGAVTPFELLSVWTKTAQTYADINKAFFKDIIPW